LGNLKGRDYSKHLGVYRRTILEWISGKEGGKMWTGYINLGFHKGEEFLD
jgi:hypothetical protein